MEVCSEYVCFSFLLLLLLIKFPSQEALQGIKRGKNKNKTKNNKQNA